MEPITSNIEIMMIGSYAFTFICAYLVISFVFYSVRMSQIKILTTTLDAKKNQARGRKLVSEVIDTAKKEKKKALLWPVIVLTGFIKHVKEKKSKK